MSIWLASKKIACPIINLRIPMASKKNVGAGLQYQKWEATGPHLLYDPLDPEFDQLPAGPRKFRAQWSLRDVEASTPLWVKRLDGMDLPAEEAE